MKEKFDRIHHIAIQVTNIEQSVKWYKKSFACNVSYHSTPDILGGFFKLCRQIWFAFILTHINFNHISFRLI